jgi:hypothetical protein
MSKDNFACHYAEELLSSLQHVVTLTSMARADGDVEMLKQAASWVPQIESQLDDLKRELIRCTQAQ